jgi:hypothetical protein
MKLMKSRGDPSSPFMKSISYPCEIFKRIV